jgi:hypothetical protein
MSTKAKRARFAVCALNRNNSIDDVVSRLQASPPLTSDQILELNRDINQKA